MQLTESRLTDIDLNDLDQWAAGVPHEWFRLLRREAPVWRHPEPDGPGFWVITRHEDVVAVGRQPEVFANAPSHIGLGSGDEWMKENARTAAGARRSQPEPAPAPGADGRHLLNLDPPEHTAYRLLVNRSFTPRAIQSLEPHTRELATRLIDGVIERGSCDFVVDLAMPLPLIVICELLGAPRADHDKICDWSNRIMGSVDAEYQTTPESSAEAFGEFLAYLEWMRDERTNNPGTDLVSKIVTAGGGAEVLPDMRFKMFVLLLFVAGNETTRNSLTHGMHALLTNPDQRQRLIDDPSLLDTAVEEVLRWATAVNYMRRTVVQPTVMHGVAMEPGDLVSIWFASANRDEAVFDDPFRFDVGRDPNPHISFGGGGPHFCLGAHLARLEIRVLLEEVLRRMPDMEATGPVERLRNTHINGVKHLPVRFTPGPAIGDR